MSPLNTKLNSKNYFRINTVYISIAKTIYEASSLIKDDKIIAEIKLTNRGIN
ncbi:MAG TPA: hypothetical protein PKD00_00280 [Burkholderiales bacterium]|nr:hypothetical protein [Burkholderiales bacterium]